MIKKPKIKIKEEYSQAIVETLFIVVITTLPTIIWALTILFDKKFLRF